MRTSSRWAGGFALLLAGLPAACLPQPPPVSAQPAPGQTPSATTAASSTPTVAWFPPTQTPSPAVALEPSPTTFPLPALGDLLLQDDFSDGSPWTLLQSERGSAGLGVGELTIVLNEPGAYIAATRTDLYLTDFFLQVTASTSLCAGQDEYGLILRAASPSDFYRFSLSCDGQFRLDLIRGGTASSPLPWTPSSAVPRNAPGTARLVVWAEGKQMHFFINDVYQLTVSTPTLPGGTVGFFARSRGENAVTVNFRELSVWELGSPDGGNADSP